ncbi:MAG: hypothetical protein EA374_08310 [Acholeplasmatales bacterium]|nr:MAG: hypothetical protein EA374_08310 [Acholeplasmatales bacterium]
MKPENRLRAQFGQMTNYVAVGLLWLATSALSLFILTGAAMTAAHKTARMLADRDKSVKITQTFVRSLRHEGLVSTAIFLGSLLLTVGLFFAYNAAVNTHQDWVVVFVIISAVELAVFNLYVYPLVATFEHPSFIVLLKNTVLFAHRHLFTTLKLIGTVTVFVWLIVRVHPSLFILALSLYFWMATVHLETVFSPYISALQEGSHEEVS